MRTPNCECIICKKPLYRRPFELKKARYVACIEHRIEAQRKHCVTENQLKALSMGRQKGTNHLEGIPKSEHFKTILSLKMSEWCRNNPQQSKDRAICHKGDNHHLWNNGSSLFNQQVRRLQELRNWQNQVKDRDGRKCTKCGSNNNLESHHIVELSVLLVQYNICSIEEARNCKELWNIENGITLCQEHHYQIHGRNYENKRKEIQNVAA